MLGEKKGDIKDNPSLPAQGGWGLGGWKRGWLSLIGNIEKEPVWKKKKMSLKSIVGVCGTKGGNVQVAFGYMALNLSKICPEDKDMGLEPTLDHPKWFLRMGPNAFHRISIVLVDLRGRY